MKSTIILGATLMATALAKGEEKSAGRSRMVA